MSYELARVRGYRGSLPSCYSLRSDEAMIHKLDETIKEVSDGTQLSQTYHRKTTGPKKDPRSTDE